MHAYGMTPALFPPITRGGTGMALFSKKDSGSKRGGGKVVVTGKRVNGTWMMETNIAPKTRRGKHSNVILETENHRVRTLH